MNITLGHIKDSDIDGLWEYVSSPQATQYLTWPAYTSRNDFVTFLAAAKHKTSCPDEFLGIYADHKIIGSVHMILRESGAVQYGLGIAPAWWGRGIGTQVIGMCIKHLKEKWPDHPIVWADIHNANAAARRVFEKNGFIIFEKNIEPSRDRFVMHLGLPSFGRIATRLVQHYYQQPGVEAIFNIGSTIANEFSDHDLVIVFNEESALNEHRMSIEEVLKGLGSALSVYQTTPTHWFAIYDTFEVLDIHLVSSSLVWALKNRKSAIDKIGFLCEPHKQSRRAIAKELYYKGTVMLARAYSKYSKGEYWVVPRFLNQIRDSSLLPLLKLYGLMPATNITRSFADTATRQGILMVGTFAAPTKDSCSHAITCAKELYALALSAMEDPGDMEKALLRIREQHA